MSKIITMDYPRGVPKKNGRSVIDRDRNFSYMGCVMNALSDASAPLHLDQLVTQVEEIRPKGESVRSAVCRALDRLYQAVPVSEGRYGWLTNLLDGSVIRHPLTAEEAARGFLMLDELEHATFFPEFFQTHRPSDRILYIELFGGPTIPAEAYIENKTWSLRLGDQFSNWIDMQGGQGRDDILIMVKDAAAGEYTVRLQPRESRIGADIQSRNIHVALLAEEIVRQDQGLKQSLSAWDLAAQLVAHKAFDHAIAPDDLHYVLHQYSVLEFENGLYILKPGHETDTAPTSSDLPAVTAPLGSIEPSLLDDPQTAPFDAFTEWEPTVGSSFVKGTSESAMDIKPQQSFGNTAISNIHDDYDTYLDFLYQAGLTEMPLTLDEFQLLKVELNGLIQIEEEFGYLLQVQNARKEQLLFQLHVKTTEDDNKDTDSTDGPDFGNPPYWGI